MHVKKFLIIICLFLPITACKVENKVTTSPIQSLPFLAIDLDGDGIELIPLEKSNVYFDVDGDGLLERTAWVHPDDGFMSVSTLEDDAKGDTIQKRLLTFNTGGLEKLESFDLNNDGQYDETDRIAKKGLSYTRPGGVSIWLDENSNGYAEKQEQYLFSKKCSVKSYNFSKETRSDIEYSGFVLCKDGKQFRK